MLIPRLDILPPSQRRLWEELAHIPAGFVLYGGRVDPAAIPAVQALPGGVAA